RTPTPTGGPPVPTGTPQPPSGGQVSCNASDSGILSTVSCQADVAGVYSSITWDSGVAPTHLEGGSADYAATVNTANTSHFQVRATVCNGTSCTESSPADVFLASSALS